MTHYVCVVLLMLYAGISAYPPPASDESYNDHRWRSREIPQPHHFGQALGRDIPQPHHFGQALGNRGPSRDIPQPHHFGQGLGNRGHSMDIPQPELFGYDIDNREAVREIPHPELFGTHHDQFDHDRDVSVGHKQPRNGRSRRQSLGQLFRAGVIDRRVYTKLIQERQDPIPELYNMNPVQEMAQKPRPCMTVCPMDYTPVCASNGQTYDNKCEMESAACRRRMVLKVRKTGEC